MAWGLCFTVVLGQAVAGRTLESVVHQLPCCNSHRKLLELDFGYYAKPCVK
jgi:hypothetical protein